METVKKDYEFLTCSPFLFLRSFGMVDVQNLMKVVFDKAIQTYEYEAFNDLYSLCFEYEETDFDTAHKINKLARNHISSAIGTNTRDFEKLYELYKRSLLFDAPYFFDAYMLYLEIDRPPKERFYQPRRKVLQPIVKKLQMLIDDELDELFLSQPPRTGKTTLALFFATFIIGRNSELTNLYTAYSDKVTSGFYEGILEIITDTKTYKWNDVFPTSKLVNKNARDTTIDINRRKRYPSITCRSIDGSLNGDCDATGIIIADDLLSGIEEALSANRLVRLQQKVDNNLITRAKGTCKLLWWGTRWSIVDPIGNRIRLLEEQKEFKDRRYAVLQLPALNDKDESNFDYDYDLGFTTKYYHMVRASHEKADDVASWLAGYQQIPVEREGTLFPAGSLRYYNGTLPDETPDRKFMPVDPAFGGGDYVAAPVCYMYGDDIYIVDVVYSNGDKYTTIPLLANAVVKYDIGAVNVEATRSTMSYKDELDRNLREKGVKINITSKAAASQKSKDERILDKAPNIKEYMVFLESGVRSADYNAFLENVFSYKYLAKNKHDDAPDSLAMAVDMAFRNTSYKPMAIKRPF